MKQYNIKALKSPNLQEAKDEIDKMIANENRRETLNEVTHLNSPELVHHAVLRLTNEMDESDVPALVNVLENLKLPMHGGEEVASYFRVKKEISEKIEKLTDVKRSESEMKDSAVLSEFLAKTKDWYHKKGIRM